VTDSGSGVEVPKALKSRRVESQLVWNKEKKRERNNLAAESERVILLL